MEQQREPMTIEEVATLLKVGAPTIHSLINRGLLHTHSEAGRVVVYYDDLVTFLREDQRALLEAGGQPPDRGLLSNQ
jgi:excisionase family DNA binding protein